MSSDPRPSHVPPVATVAFLALVLAAPLGAQSNWVNWTDQTATRLQLSTVPLADKQEKDVAVGDLDNDGDTDLVIARKIPFSNPGARSDVLLMNEGGVLVERTSTLIPDFLTPDDARDILVHDLNLDGWMDIVTVNTFGEQPRLFLNQGLDGSGTFLGFTEEASWFSPVFVPGPKFCAVSAGDVSGDGAPDLFFSDYNNPLEDKLLINDGTGHFTDETDLRMTAAMKASAFGTGNVIADFNGDGWGDIVKITTLFAPSGLRLLINDGTGSFGIMQSLNYNAVYMLDAADFDNDGRLDLYVESDNQDYQLINTSTNPDGTINTTKIMVSSSNKTAGFGGNVHSADLDRDGYPDIGVADVDVDIPGCTRRFGALNNMMGATGTNGLSDPNNPTTLAWNSQGNHDFAWIDIDSDGFSDLFQATCNGYLVFMMDPFAAASAFGEGCSGTNGVPQIGSVGTPSLGSSSFVLTLDHAAPNAAPLLLLSDTSASVQTPSGCTLLVDAASMSVFGAPATDAAGALQLHASIPADPALEGVRFFVQWAVPDPAGPFGAGWALSDGLDVYLSAMTL